MAAMIRTRTDIADELTELTRYAKRQQHLVKRFTDDDPTDWDESHQWINDLLAEWQQATA
jgi:hypothetical protein